MLPLVFLQASLASLLAGAAAWYLLRIAARIWPALQAHRAPWLLAVAAVAGTLAMGLLPASWRPSIVPALELPSAIAPASVRAARDQATTDATDATAPAGATASRPAAARAADVAPDAERTTEGASDAPVAAPLALAQGLQWLGYAWLAIYLAGLIAAAIRWRQAKRRLDILLAASQRLDRSSLAAHAGFANLPQAGLPPVREIDAPIAPMLVGLLRPTLLLPRHLRDFAPEQQRLVIEHELTHLARRDPLWMHLGLLLRTLQWFNPMVSRLARQMAWAQELGCDRRVLQQRPATQRRAYAAALLAQMRLQAVPDYRIALGFGGRMVDAVASRIGMIRDGVPTLPRAARTFGWALLPAALAASIVLQPALAWRPDAASTAAAAAGASQAAPDTTLPRWQAPMAQLRVSAFFGVVQAATGQPHGGMDFAARTGTPVLALDDGIVVESTASYQGETKWGKLIAIQHANGLRPLYAHLDQRRVWVGDRVKAGQQIATSGASGKVTGPHLHLEISRNGKNIDPQLLLGNLEASATPKALQRLNTSRAP